MLAPSDQLSPVLEPTTGDSTPVPLPLIKQEDADLLKQESQDPVSRPGLEDTAVPKKKPATKASADVLQRRREGRMKAAATIAAKIEKLGIQRVENDVVASLIRPVQMINQKNYYTEYLKKDEQAMFVRKLREDRLNQVSTKRLKREAAADAAALAAATNSKKEVFDLDDDDDDDGEEEDGDQSQDAGAQFRQQMRVDRNGSRTIVIHPGSVLTRIGLADRPYPVSVPTALAVPVRLDVDVEMDAGEPEPRRQETDEGISFGEDFKAAKRNATKDFKERMRYYKRRIVPNLTESVAAFNRKLVPEPLPDHNDVHDREWITPPLSQDDRPRCYLGQDALRLVPSPHYRVRYPLARGRFTNNTADYALQHEVFGDLQILVAQALAKEYPELLGDSRSFPQFSVVLVIPDLYDKVYCEEWVQLLLQMRFQRVAVIQESVAATFGAGVLLACVVDIGATTTTVACVEEGMVVNDSQVRLDYGTNDIARAFIKMMLQLHLPYPQLDLRKPADWEFAQELATKFVTFNDADIAVQLYSAYRRQPNKPTEKVEFKVFDEVMLAPMGLFFPEVFEIDDAVEPAPLFRPLVDQYSLQPDNPVSKAHELLQTGTPYVDLEVKPTLVKLLEKEVQYGLKPKQGEVLADGEEILGEELYWLTLLTAPLEHAIIESISNACKQQVSLGKHMYENLMLVGGGAKISGFDGILADRISIWRPRLLLSTALPDILNYAQREQDALTARIAKRKKEKESKKPPTSVNGLTGAAAASVAAAAAAAAAAAGQTTGEGATPLEQPNDELDEEEEELVLDLDKIDAMVERAGVLLVGVLAPPKDIDPQILVWKGGCVYLRLKIASEMWVTGADWAMFGGRCLHYKSLFNY